MTTQKILTFATQLPGCRVEPIFSPMNLDEWPTIVWLQSNLLNPDHPNFEHKVQIVAKLAEIKKWVSVGRTLIVLLDQSGFKVTLNGLQGILPAPQVSPASGTEVKAVGIFSTSRVQNYARLLHYHQTIIPSGGTPFLEIDVEHSSKPKTVGAIYRVEKGAVILAPQLANVSVLPQYVEALLSLQGILNSEPEVLSSWTRTYQLSSEKIIVSQMASFDSQIDDLHKKKQEAQAVLDQDAWLKTLIAGTGEALHQAVIRALKEIGFQAASVPGKRTDILARDGDRLLVLEVKGFDNRGARSEDVRQAVAWRSDVELALVAGDDTVAEDVHLKQLDEAFSTLGIARQDPSPFTCKAALAVEGYRLQPLADRGIVFSAELIREMMRLNVCAITGTQILGLVMKVRSGADAAEIRNAFFGTDGLMATDDWGTFLSQIA